MFTSARITLTAWYLLIIMCISLSFSAVIFQVLNREIERFARAQRIRFERRYFDNSIEFLPPHIDPELIEETSEHLLYILITVNGVILAVSGYLGFFLAGRTLKPIQTMIDDQNRFISDSSHELRTPLTAMKSSMEVNLRDKKLTLKNAKAVIRESIDEVDKLQSLSDSLLQLASYQSQDHKQNFEKIKLSEIIHESIRKIKPLADNKHIEITVMPAEMVVYGNKYSLIELLIILLDNAIKYSNPISIVSVAIHQTKSHVSIKIQDSGIGIPEKDIHQIFNRFYRADTARCKTTINGYGLGLSIAKKIVEFHNGSITVESKINEGSVFTVRLPVSRSANFQA